MVTPNPCSPMAGGHDHEFRAINPMGVATPLFYCIYCLQEGQPQKENTSATDHTPDTATHYLDAAPHYAKLRAIAPDLPIIIYPDGRCRIYGGGNPT